jgi:acyl-coenzyme A thioesterase PaaI-like protein
MKQYFLIIFAFVLLFSVQPALAEEAASAHGMPDEAAMQKVMELGMPGEAHKVLDRLTGEWTYTMTHKMSADAPKIASEGISKNEWILGGRFIQQNVSSTFDMNGQTINYEGVGTAGHDNVKGHFITTWMDNMGTGMMAASAEYDEATATLKEKGTYSCSMRGGEVTFTAELKFVDDDHFTYAMYETDENGKTFQMMDMKYTRQ